MTNPVEQAEGIANCHGCEWQTLCVAPPTMTEEEVKERTKLPEKTEGEDATGKLMDGLMSALVFAGKDRECKACPVFIARLRQSPALAQKIKETMQNWEV